MKQNIIHPTGVESITLSEMAEAAMPVSPRLVFSGMDRAGEKRNAEIILDDFLTLPTHAKRVTYMAETGGYAASVSPYIANVEEIYFVHKTIADLQKAGYEKEELLLVISGYDIRLAKKASHAYLLFAQNDESIGFTLIDTALADQHVNPPHIYEEIQAFLSGYAYPASTRRKGVV